MNYILKSNWFLLVVVLCCSCSNTTNRTLTYGIGQKFILAEGEQEVALVKEKVKLFEYMCAPGNISLPINKIIESSNYAIYISFSDTALTVQSYTEIIKMDSSNVVLSQRSTTLHEKKASVLLFKNKQIYVNQYWKVAKAAGMQEVFTLVTTDSLLASKFYNENEFLQMRLEK